MKQPSEAVDISEEQYSQLLQRVERKELSDEDWTWVVKILRAYWFFAQLVRNQKVTIKKLGAMLFGKKTEKTKKNKTNKDIDSPHPEDVGPLTLEEAKSKSISNQNISDSQMNPKMAAISAPLQSALVVVDQSEPQSNSPKPKAPGHGQRGHESWENAKVQSHKHALYQPGCPCPKCKEGTLYLYKTPAVWVRFNGGAPLVAEVHELERLRCNPCGALFTAAPPEDLRTDPKATPEARATAAIIKYQGATPFNRFAAIQKNYGHPIPRTRIWTLCQEMGAYTEPVMTSLIAFAAQGTVVQNDDTKVRILQLMKENQIAEESGNELERTGMYTTGVVSQVGEHKIYLFFSSRKHAGENLADILSHRDPTLPPPTQVCDASNMNTSPGKGKTDVEFCHDHGRRLFAEIRNSYPKSCDYALEEWAIVYRVDAIAKKLGLNETDRLHLHQLRSAPALERLHNWCIQCLDKKKVEPRGHLGHAMKYFLDHYSELTLFLRKPGVPISNCECEQALKTAIGVRKMAYFFKTLTGANVADAMFSLIATCNAARANLFHYLVILQKNEAKVREAPELWYPWNYQIQLKQT